MRDRRRRKLVALALIATAALSGGALLWLHQQGRANLQACGGLDPGGQRTELIQILGAPASTRANPAGTRLLLSFRSPLWAEKPIRAIVNIRDDVVMEIDCGDGRIKTYDKY